MKSMLVTDSSRVDNRDCTREAVQVDRLLPLQHTLDSVSLRALETCLLSGERASGAAPEGSTERYTVNCVNCEDNSRETQYHAAQSRDRITRPPGLVARAGGTIAPQPRAPPVPL